MITFTNRTYVCFTLLTVLSKILKSFNNISIVRVDYAFQDLLKIIYLHRETMYLNKRNIYLDAFEPPYKFL